jgi:prepilin peptidase CpaA
MEMKEVTLLLAGAFALAAGWTDWRSRRIPNWLTVSAAVVGIGANSIIGGWHGAVTALEGLGLGLVLLFPFVIVRALGAGDWKLVGAMGGFLGPRQLLAVLVGALLVSGVMALALVIYKGRLGQTMRNIGRLLVAFASGRPGDPTISLDNPDAAKVPFGVAFAVAVILYLGQRAVLGSWNWFS